MTGLPPEQQIKTLFTQRHLTLASAESCTGGLLAGRITDMAGSSAYFMGGVVSYDNAAKMALLGVSEAALIAEGAVSAAVAIQMAVGVRERLQVDVGVSVTGIAGPGGGTPEKPVGLTFIGLADRAGGHAERFLWAGDRGSNREESVLAALRMLIAWAEGQD